MGRFRKLGGFQVCVLVVRVEPVLLRLLELELLVERVVTVFSVLVRMLPVSVSMVWLAPCVL